MNKVSVENQDALKLRTDMVALLGTLGYAHITVGCAWGFHDLVEHLIDNVERELTSPHGGETALAECDVNGLLRALAVVPNIGVRENPFIARVLRRPGVSIRNAKNELVTFDVGGVSSAFCRAAPHPLFSRAARTGAPRPFTARTCQRELHTFSSLLTHAVSTVSTIHMWETPCIAFGRSP